MADCEQGFFKTGMTVLPENYPPDLDRRLEESEEMEDNELFLKQEVESKRRRIGRNKREIDWRLSTYYVCIMPQMK